MAIAGSRWFYRLSQTPWHRGVTHEEAKLRLDAKLRFSSPGDWVDLLYFSTVPSVKQLQSDVAPLNDLVQMSDVLRWMKISLDSDPSYVWPAFDMSYLLFSRYHRPDLATEVIANTLKANHSAEDDVTLLTMDCYIVAKGFQHGPMLVLAATDLREALGRYLAVPGINAKTPKVAMAEGILKMKEIQAAEAAALKEGK